MDYDLSEPYALIRLPLALLAKRIGLPPSATIEAAEINIAFPGEITFRLRGVGSPLIGEMIAMSRARPILTSETNAEGHIIKETLEWPSLT